MSRKAVTEFTNLAVAYTQQAQNFPEGHLGRIGNEAEAAKYRGLAVAARSWPEEEETVPEPA